MSRRAYPADLYDREAALLDQHPPDPLRPGPVGVAISGGGVRSATFALGVFQAWASKQQLGRIAYLSTVSGGGYFGAFLGRLFSRSYVRSVADVEWILRGGAGQPPPPHADRTEEEEQQLSDAGGSVLKWLRENGRYLSPRGAGDVLIFSAALLRNWVSIHVLLLLSGVVVFLALQAPRFLLTDGSLAVARIWDVPVAIQGGRSQLWWSPWTLIAGLILMLGLPIIWAYWLAWRRERPWERWVPVLASVGLGAAATWGALGWLGAGGDRLQTVGRFAGAMGAATVVMVLLGRVRVAWSLRREDASPSDHRGLLRNRLAGDLKNVLVATAILAALALVDTLGQTIYAVTSEGQLRPWLAAVGAGIAGVGAFARHIALLLGGPAKATRPGWMAGGAAYAGGFLLVLILLVGYDLLANGIVWNFGPVRAARPPIDEWAYAIWLGSVLVLLLAFGRSVPFVNESTHHPLYTARLTRAYLGASNPKRWSGRSTAVIEPLPDDDVASATYWAPDPAATAAFYGKGAPLHLVNVTINETFDGKSQVQQQDRKGLAMAVGPGGISIGVGHHVVFSREDAVRHRGTLYWKKLELDDRPADFRVFEYDQSKVVYQGGEIQRTSTRFLGEPLSLGAWVALSGAAFSTGLGARTNIGMSLLTGLFNVRLGHWWDSGLAMKKRRFQAAEGRFLTGVVGRAFGGLLPLHYYLLSELVARFPGVARRHWYLSDGGHFENLGAYELIRRRLPTIVIIDAEQDAEYGFKGLANLVRKARIDFGADIDFGGSLDALRPQGDGSAGLTYSGAHVARARVTYGVDEPEDQRSSGHLVYLKASLTGDEDPDVLEYARRQRPFPHQTTADQFFDEEQWESYRRLGEHIGSLVEVGEAD